MKIKKLSLNVSAVTYLINIPIPFVEIKINIVRIRLSQVKCPRKDSYGKILGNV